MPSWPAQGIVRVGEWERNYGKLVKRKRAVDVKESGGWRQVLEARREKFKEVMSS